MKKKRINRPCNYCGEKFRKKSRRDYICDKCAYINKVSALRKSARKRGRNVFQRRLKKLRVR